MKLIIISGRSGSGKSTALRALEDAGFNCIDNFPVELLPSLVANALAEQGPYQENQAVCIDARSHGLDTFPDFYRSIDSERVNCEVIYLDALSGTLVKRFSETRRRHPLTNDDTDLLQAIESEKAMLADISNLADLTLDTTLMRGSELVELIRGQVASERAPGIAVLFRSFGYKFGVPVDADLVFDIRCLPNPYWDEPLRPLTGADQPVIDYLAAQQDVNEMFEDIRSFLERWIPRFEADNRAYMNIAIGCTGGRHRSVYMAERLRAYFDGRFGRVLVRHRETVL
ncbi:MAG: RNase adapter RapZ [Pseudomonadota bacterium]